MIGKLERTTEPSVCADRFPAKTKDKFTKLVLLERQTHIHEIHVPATFGISMFHSRPHRYGVGALPVQLVLGGKIP